MSALSSTFDNGEQPDGVRAPKKIRPMVCLFRDGPSRGPVVAVQDTAGSVYRRLLRRRRPGEIIAKRIAGVSKFPMSVDGFSFTNFKIVRPVSADVVASIVRSHFPELTIDRSGYWYEVHED